MKKALFVDIYSEQCHRSFNSIYIKELCGYFEEMHFCFKEGYKNDLDLPSNAVVNEIPNDFYNFRNNKVWNLLITLRIMLFLRSKLLTQFYDQIFFSSYEVYTFYFAFINIPVVLVNHNNLRNLNNPIKLFLFKRIARKNRMIVFNDYIKQYLDSLSVDNVYVVPHGIPEPFNLDVINYEQGHSKFSFVLSFQRIIFSPSSSSTDAKFIQSLLNSDEFMNYLNSNNFLLVLKGKYDVENQKNVCVIETFLSEMDYQFLFLKSDLILLVYPNSFSYRVSAVFFECLANDKVTLMKNIQSFKVNEGYLNYSGLFDTVSDLIFKIEDIFIDWNRICQDPYTNKSNRVCFDFSKVFYKKVR